VEVIDTEILAMNLVGGGPIILQGPLMSGPVMLRLDTDPNPIRPSTGQTTIEPAGGGLYHIDSFFDVFTELSLDGGNTWTPSSGAIHMSLNPVPEPATLALGGACLVAALRRRLHARKRA